MAASPIEAAGEGATGSSRSPPAKFCSGHIARLASLAPGFRSDASAEICPRLSYSLSLRAREAERRQQGRSSCSTCWRRRCGAAPLAGAGVFDLAKLVVSIQGDDGAWAVTDAADGGIADRGGGRGTYRVIDFDAGKFCSRHIGRRRAFALRVPARRNGAAAPARRLAIQELWLGTERAGGSSPG